MSLQRKSCQLRHCMVVYALYPYYETRVQREAEALLEAGHDVDVICPRRPDDAPRDTHRGVNIYRVAKRWRRKEGLLAQLLEYIGFFCLASLKLAKLHRQRRYDVVQAHNVPDFLVFTALLPKLTGARVILDLHDLMPEFYQGRSGQAPDSPSVRLVLMQERLCCRFADHVITVTEHWREALIQRGVPPEKCSVVMNLADDRVFQPLPIGRTYSSEGDSRFRLLYHGGMPARYGLDMILQAVHRLRSQIPGIHLTLVGGGDQLESLKRLANELDLNENHVEFIPGVPVDQLPPLIAAADVGVVPYHGDAFTASLLPTKLMEYAAMGLPAVVARTDAISRYFDESMVEFFTPEDVEGLTLCLLCLYTERERLAELAQGIRKFNERYNWPKESVAYIRMVDRLAASKGRRDG